MPYRFARAAPATPLAMMGLPKFTVGQRVEFAPGPLNPKSAAPKSFTILRVLPAEGTRRTYRIKGDTENFERVAEEVQLAEVGAELH